MAIEQTLPLMPQLKLNKEGKPAVPRFTIPEPTKLDLEWQSLRTLDLSMLDGTPEQQKECEETFMAAMENEGFLLIKNYGVPPEELQRIYDLADWTINSGECLSEQDKEDYLWDFDSGNWAGYKPPKGWNERGKEHPDSLEFYNWYGECWAKDKIPPKLRPFQDEILAYASHMYNQVAKRVLVIMSRSLGLPDSTVWDRCAAKGHELPWSSYCRFQVVHPVPPGQRDQDQAVLYGHTDHGCTTFIPAQPVACLQIFGKDGKWRYVPYVEGTLVANLGDVMEVASGGIFKATRHRVVRPVEDQAHHERVSVISFNHADPDFVMAPLYDAPLIKSRGVNVDSGICGPLVRSLKPGEQPPTFGNWRHQRNLLAQKSHKQVVKDDGHVYAEHDVGGVKIYQKV